MHHPLLKKWYWILGAVILTGSLVIRAYYGEWFHVLIDAFVILCCLDYALEK